MIYICCIKYAREGRICMLAIGDDEHNVGDDVAALLEVAEGGTRGKLKESRGLLCRADTANWLRVSGRSWDKGEKNIP